MSAIERRSRSTYPIPDLYEITNNLVSLYFRGGTKTCARGCTNPEAPDGAIVVIVDDKNGDLLRLTRYRLKSAGSCSVPFHGRIHTMPFHACARYLLTESISAGAYWVR